MSRPMPAHPRLKKRLRTLLHGLAHGRADWSQMRSGSRLAGSGAAGIGGRRFGYGDGFGAGRGEGLRGLRLGDGSRKLGDGGHRRPFLPSVDERSSSRPRRPARGRSSTVCLSALLPFPCPVQNGTYHNSLINPWRTIHQTCIRPKRPYCAECAPGTHPPGPLEPGLRNGFHRLHKMRRPAIIVS